MGSHELIVFCITVLIESEPSHLFSTPADNWALTWFGARIFQNYTILLIFGKKYHFQIVLVENRQEYQCI